VILWTQGIFDPGANFLEALIKTLDTTDFAILVMTPDDVILSGDEVSLAPRDNVLFELGLFMGRLGRERCFFVHERDLKLKISSDLLGISAVKYRRFAQRQFEGRVGKRASDIKDRITSLDRRLRLQLLQQEGAARADVLDISGTWLGYTPNLSDHNSILEIEQSGLPIHAVIVRQVQNGARRRFEYEGRLSSGQLFLFFEEDRGRGFIVGTLVLHLSIPSREGARTTTRRRLWPSPESIVVEEKRRTRVC
jgi:hypothetical protein